MTNQLGRVVGVTIVGLGLLALVVQAPAGDQTYPGSDVGERAADALRAETGDRLPMSAADSADAIAANWGAASRRAAQAMLEKYGQPDEASDSQLVWHNTGAFQKTIVYKEELRHNFPSPHEDVLEQFVEFRFPTDKYNDLARFDGSVHADRTAGLLSARGASEPDNYAALNLAHDIALGRRDAANARAALVRVHRLTLSGKKSPYTQGLLFKARSHNQADPDIASR